MVIGTESNNEISTCIKESKKVLTQASALGRQALIRQNPQEPIELCSF